MEQMVLGKEHLVGCKVLNQCLRVLSYDVWHLNMQRAGHNSDKQNVPIKINVNLGHNSGFAPELLHKIEQNSDLYVPTTCGNLRSKTTQFRHKSIPKESRVLQQFFTIQFHPTNTTLNWTNEHFLQLHHTSSRRTVRKSTELHTPGPKSSELSPTPSPFNHQSRNLCREEPYRISLAG